MSDVPADPLLHPSLREVRRWPGWVRWAAYGFSVALLILSVWFALEQTELETIRKIDPTRFLGLIGCTLASLLLNALLFQLATRPFERGSRVGVVEWQALIGASALLNYLPMRAGMVGRLAYLKTRHGIRYRANVTVLLLSLGGTLSVYGLLAGVTLWRQRIDASWCLFVAAAAALLALLFWPVVARAVSRRAEADRPRGRLLLITVFWVAVRILDSLVFATRYQLAAEVLGHSVGLAGALVVSTACNIVVLGTPLPGGLGLREWLGGWLFTFPLLAASDLSLEKGMGVLLTDRAAEVVAFVMAGLVAIGWLHWRAVRVPAGTPRPRSAREEIAREESAGEESAGEEIECLP